MRFTEEDHKMLNDISRIVTNGLVGKVNDIRKKIDGFERSIKRLEVMVIGMVLVYAVEYIGLADLIRSVVGGIL